MSESINSLSRKPHILIVEDYEILREELCDFLSFEGFDVHGVESGKELDAVLQLKVPEVLVLDLNLPGEDGISIASRMRKSHPNIGIVMMTARVDHADRIEGYETGADIYLTKPVKPEELVLVLRNLLKRLQQPYSGSETSWIFNSTKQLLINPQGAEITLTGNEAIFFKCLATAPTHRADVSELLLMLEKEDDEAGKMQLEALVSRLRKKIAPHANGEQLIKAAWGKGYQLCVECRLQ